jgi:hypothetical protein
LPPALHAADGWWIAKAFFQRHRLARFQHAQRPGGAAGFRAGRFGGSEPLSASEASSGTVEATRYLAVIRALFMVSPSYRRIVRPFLSSIDSTIFVHGTLARSRPSEMPFPNLVVNRLASRA